MRVIHFVPYYPPERLGGVGEYAARLHRALGEAGHESLVVTRGRRSEPGVERIARSGLGWFLRGALLAGRCADYDVVHVHAGEALPLLLALSLRRRRPRILSTFHVSYAGVAQSLRPYTLEGKGLGGGWRSWLERVPLAWGHRVIDRVAVGIADAVVPITRACATEVLGERGAAGARVVYHGLPALSATAGASAPEPVELLYVGAAGHRKRVAALPAVLSHVRSEVPDARLRIVGFDWKQQPALRALFAERGLLDAVDCAGFVESRHLPEHYRSARVLVVPSAYEGLPLVIIEAMQCGLPVVATRVSGHPEAIDDGKSGYLVPLDDPRALAERCVALLRDPQLGAELGENARRTANTRFGMERHLREYLALYTELCERA